MAWWVSVATRQGFHDAGKCRGRYCSLSSTPNRVRGTTDFVIICSFSSFASRRLGLGISRLKQAGSFQGVCKLEQLSRPEELPLCLLFGFFPAMKKPLAADFESVPPVRGRRDTNASSIGFGTAFVWACEDFDSTSCERKSHNHRAMQRWTVFKKGRK